MENFSLCRRNSFMKMNEKREENFLGRWKRTWKRLSLFSARSLSRFLFFLGCFRRHATGSEDLTKNHRQEPKLSFLIKAIYTMAYGLQAYHDDVCGREFIGVCPKLHKSFNHSIFFVSSSIQSDSRSKAFHFRII